MTVSTTLRDTTVTSANHFSTSIQKETSETPTSASVSDLLTTVAWSFSESLMLCLHSTVMYFVRGKGYVLWSKAPDIVLSVEFWNFCEQRLKVEHKTKHGGMFLSRRSFEVLSLWFLPGWDLQNVSFIPYHVPISHQVHVNIFMGTQQGIVGSIHCVVLMSRVV